MTVEAVAGQPHGETPGKQRDPELNTTHEIRFAVVLYGGVSLAIYMNGVAQELLHLVRATAPTQISPAESDQLLVPEAKLTGSEQVYRDIARLLEAWKTSSRATAESVKGRPVTTRFVVDVLSGSSAGGINGVFLGKALANNEPMDTLESLWVTQGDLSVLLNDKDSAVGAVGVENPPQSLLNSERMYYELLVALKGMDDAETKPPRPSPYVRELDLWVTTTDLRGVMLPMQLSNGVAYERRHRSVWHFAYGTAAAQGRERNDFVRDNTPFLAFAARSTSAFPAAFRPVEFQDITDAVARAGYRDLIAQPAWQTFYSDYLVKSFGANSPLPIPQDQLPFDQRPFADGGALDNKPFTWATSMLTRRRADIPVTRKLIYVEPDPGHPELETTKQGRPDLIENTLLQAIELPRQETIRQDLQAVMDRNQLLARIEMLLDGVIDGLRPGGTSEITASHDSGYTLLRLESTTDAVASLVARWGEVDQDSGDLRALTLLVGRWRESIANNGARQSKFLGRFDLEHHLRRLNFLKSRADALDVLDRRQRRVILVLAHSRPSTEAARADFRRCLQEIKTEISRISVGLNGLSAALRQARVTDPGPPNGAQPAQPSALVRAARDLVGRTDFEAILSGPGDVVADRVYFEEWSGFNDNVAEPLAALLADGLGMTPYGTTLAMEELGSVLEPKAGESSGERAARAVMKAYNEAFDSFDTVALPMLSGTDAGEAVPVDIVRISPQDAPSIVDAKDPGAPPKTRGNTFHHFGAFLDERWRRNDIMFGRLDAAEVLINTLLPASMPGWSISERDQLLLRAQKAIIVESMKTAGDLRAAIFGPRDLAGMDPAALVDVLRDSVIAGTAVPRSLPPTETLPLVSRGLRVLGRVLKGDADHSRFNAPFGWVARIGATAADVIDICAPGAPWWLLARHLSALFVLLGAVLTGLGYLSGSASATHLGVEILLVTIGLILAAQVVRSELAGRHWLAKTVCIILAVVVVVVTASATAEIGRNGDHVGCYWHDLDHLGHLGTPPSACSAL